MRELLFSPKTLGDVKEFGIWVARKFRGCQIQPYRGLSFVFNKETYLNYQVYQNSSPYVWNEKEYLEDLDKFLPKLEKLIEEYGIEGTFTMDEV